MTKHQHKNKTINNNQGNMSPLEEILTTTIRTEYFNTSDTQENDIKINYVKMMDVFKEEWENPLHFFCYTIFIKSAVCTR